MLNREEKGGGGECDTIKWRKKKEYCKKKLHFALGPDEKFNFWNPSAAIDATHLRLYIHCDLLIFSPGFLSSRERKQFLFNRHFFPESHTTSTLAYLLAMQIGWIFSICALSDCTFIASESFENYVRADAFTRNVSCSIFFFLVSYA